MHMRSQKLLCTHDDIRDGVRVLRRRCAVMKRIHDRTGDPPLRRFPADFAGLARIIVGQQLSIASASAIWLRLERGLKQVSAAKILRARYSTLAAAGLSAPKMRTLKALAAAVADERSGVQLEQLERASDEDVHAMLTTVSGIGPWTADIFVMFALGRADAWAAGDLALQVGVARAFGLGERVSAQQSLEVAERWRPWRGVAARLIWADYAELKRTALPDASRNERAIVRRAAGKQATVKSRQGVRAR